MSQILDKMMQENGRQNTQMKIATLKLVTLNDL